MTAACVKGELEKVKYLIKLGADINAWDGDGYYPLDVASQNGRLELVKYLVNQGADVLAGGSFAVRTACSRGHLEVVKYLLSVGADIGDKFDYAVKMSRVRGHTLVTRYLIGTILNEVKKCTLSLLLNNKRAINKDLLPLNQSIELRKCHVYHH